jgi:hypothetical protein
MSASTANRSRFLWRQALGLAAVGLSCGSPQDPFLGTYDAQLATTVTFSAGKRCRDGCTEQVESNPVFIVTGGPGNQLIFTLQSADGGSTCILTGTAQSGSAFAVDTQTGQGCEGSDPDGGTLETIVQAGSGTVDSLGNLQMNASGTLSWTPASGGLTATGTFQQALQGARDGG